MSETFKGETFRILAQLIDTGNVARSDLSHQGVRDFDAKMVVLQDRGLKFKTTDEPWHKGPMTEPVLVRRWHLDAGSTEAARRLAGWEK